MTMTVHKGSARLCQEMNPPTTTNTSKIIGSVHDKTPVTLDILHHFFHFGLYLQQILAKQEAGDGPGLCRAYILCGEIRPALSVSIPACSIRSFAITSGSALFFLLIRIPNSMWK